MNMRLIEHNPPWSLDEAHRVHAQQGSYVHAPPVVQQRLKVPVVSAHSPQQGNVVPDKPHILIVDCESTTALLTQSLAQACHIQRVSSVDQILEEVARCPDQSPDLILLDSLAPSHQVLDICRQLKADETTHTIPVILIIEGNNAEDEACALALGVEDCISRPLHMNVVEARIRNQIRLKLKHDLLERYANQDGLTEVANRRRFDLVLDAEWRRAIRDQQSLSVLMVDVDCFKQFNDLYGHREGDHCLRRVAKAMTQALTRPGDVLARYGGEEFAAVLPGIDIEGARWMGERLRHAVMELRIPQQRPDGARRVSISVGCASMEPSPNLACHSLLQAADEQLYLAKHSGRDCVR